MWRYLLLPGPQTDNGLNGDMHLSFGGVIAQKFKMAHEKRPNCPVNLMQHLQKIAFSQKYCDIYHKVAFSVPENE